MNTYIFKTTINCNGCIIKAKKVLNIEEIQSWEIDVDNPDKILKIKSETLNAKDIITKLKMIGFSAEEIVNQ